VVVIEGITNRPLIITHTCNRNKCKSQLEE
jgi:hypothetical protein